MDDPITATRNRLTLSAFGHNPQAGRWRTEAMRAHDTPRLMYFNKGQGRITVAGLTSGFGPNNLIFIPPRTMYGFEAGPTVFGQVVTIPDAMAGEWPEEHVHLRLRDVVAQKELATLVDALERELLSDRPGHLRAAHHQLGLLAIYFERQLQLRGEEIPRAETAAARLVAAYTDLVERDFRLRKGVAGFAAELGVTPTHLARCCRQTCGRSALSILNDRVIYEARLLLRETDAPVGRIAASLGFASPAYFTRAFQSQTGMTPSAFRAKGVTAPL